MVGGIMSDVFYEMSKVTMKPVVNYTVLQIFLISSLNFTLVVAFCTVAGNISYTFTPRTLGLFKCIVYLYLVPFLNLTFLLLRKLMGGLTKSIIPALLLCLYIKLYSYTPYIWSKEYNELSHFSTALFRGRSRVFKEGWFVAMEAGG